MNPRAGAANPSRAAWISVILVTVITLLAYANAAHDTLVLDDKVFVGENRTIAHESLADTFATDIWHNANFKGFFRPLLLINFELENRLFGGWARGYHLVNIGMHLAASLLLLGFLRCLLALRVEPGRTLELAALIATLVFAVHPINTEVVNSVFNRSSIWVSICAISGLWWLFSRLETRPASAWLGLGLFYCIGILFKESALVIPGLAVALIVTLTHGRPVERIRRFLPVFWLLLPIAVYFYLRFNALAPESAGDNYGAMLATAEISQEGGIAYILGSTGLALKMLAWPWPLELYHGRPEGSYLTALIVGQAVLAVAAVVLFFRNRPALAAGLAFFYTAYLPASRVISMDGSLPHLAERYLYFPSIGLAITLAFAMYALVRRYGSRPAIALSLPLLLLFASVTWDRNHDWSSELSLFETEYANGSYGRALIRVLVTALSEDGQYSRIAEICDENEDRWAEDGRFSNTCATNYLRQKRPDDAIRAFEASASNEDTWLQGHLALGTVLIDMGRKQEGADHFAYCINRLDDPAQKELYKGVLWVKLYPRNRAKLAEARAHFEKALELDPELEAAQGWIDHLDAHLSPETVPEALEN